MDADPPLGPRTAAGAPTRDVLASPDDAPLARPSASGVDRRAWLLALAAFAVALAATAVGDALVISLRTGHRVPGDWFAYLDWQTFGWFAAGLVLVAVVGSRWSGSWSLYLLWAMPSVCWGLSRLLVPVLSWADIRPSRFHVFNLSLPSVAILVAGVALLSAAFLQARAWRGSHTGSEAGKRAAPLRRLILGGWVALMVSYAVVGATWQHLIGDRFDILAATLVAAVAWQVAAWRRGAVWVFALVGAYLAADALQTVSLLIVYPDTAPSQDLPMTLYSWSPGMVFTALLQLAWAGAVLTAAWRLRRSGDDGGDPLAARLSIAAVDRRAWWIAVIALIGAVAVAVVGSALRYSLTRGRWLPLDWPPDIAWVTVVWMAVGLVAVVAVGRRWAGVWVIYLMWAVRLLYWSLTETLAAIPVLSEEGGRFPYGESLGRMMERPFERRMVAVAELGAIFFGTLLASAAVRQARVWRRGLAPAAGRPLPPARVALVLAGWIALLASYVIAHSFSVLSVGDVRDLMLATAVAAVALLVAYLPRGAVWVFAVAGAYFASFAFADLLTIVVDRHLSWGVLWLGAAPFDALWRHRFLAATLLTGIVQLAWAIVLLVVAWRLALSGEVHSTSAARRPSPG